MGDAVASMSTVGSLSICHNKLHLGWARTRRSGGSRTRGATAHPTRIRKSRAVRPRSISSETDVVYRPRKHKSSGKGTDGRDLLFGGHIRQSLSASMHRHPPRHSPGNSFRCSRSGTMPLDSAVPRGVRAPLRDGTSRPRTISQYSLGGRRKCHWDGRRL